LEVCPRPVCGVFYTDVDGTMIDSQYRLDPEAPAAAARLQEAGIAVVLVTSKTLEEALLYVGRLGLRRCPGYAVIAEEGAVIHAPPGVLPEETIVLGRVSPEEALSLIPSGCRGRVKPIQWMTVEEVEELTGLPSREAEAARLRRATVALHGPRGCLEEGLRRALASGLYARLGRVFLIVGRHPGKAGAAVELERRSPRLRLARLRAAAGDDPMDEELLALADLAVVVAEPSTGRPRFTPRLQGYVLAEPPPAGWRRLAERLAGAAASLCGLHAPP